MTDNFDYYAPCAFVPPKRRTQATKTVHLMAAGTGGNSFFNFSLADLKERMPDATNIRCYISESYDEPSLVVELTLDKLESDDSYAEYVRAAKARHDETEFHHALIRLKRDEKAAQMRLDEQARTRARELEIYHRLKKEFDDKDAS